MTDNNLYYQQRVQEELAAADAAGDDVISRIHRDMAQRYRDLVDVEPQGKGSDVEPGTAVG